MKNKVIMLVFSLIGVDLLVGFIALRELSFPGDAAALAGLGLLFALAILNAVVVRRWRKQLQEW